MSFEQDDSSRDSAYRLARERVQVPAIFLVIVGLINILAAGTLLFAAYQVSQISEEEFRQLFSRSPEYQEMLRKLEDQGWTPERLQHAGIVLYGTCGGVGLLAALITFVGGVRMMALKSYGLSLTGAFLAAIPFVSPLGCCLVGEIIGIWAVVVLFSADVQAGYREARMPPSTPGDDAGNF
jgi:hypothetical protein